MKIIRSLLNFNVRCLLCAFLAAVLAPSPAVSQAAPPATASVPVVMLSDVHFDPLQDPAKVPLLVKAPVSGWRAILDLPASPDQATRFAAVQETCSGKGATDSSYALFRSSLSAARANTPNAAFVTVSGDLLVHDLDCRYRAALGMAPSTSDDQSVSAAFAEKTTVFVMNEIESTFPRIPVYLALGNNDSRCNHNRMDLHDAYLKESAAAVVAGLRGISAQEKVQASKTYQSAGYYAVTMAKLMANTRLIVVNDIYMMPKFENCEADAGDRSGEQEQTAWLRKELQAARDNHQHVWILGHLPPVVNPDASLSGKGPFCTAGKVVRFQTSDDLADQMMANADLIKLGIFGHTHMDELHLLPAPGGGVPIKVVASVTPVAGSLPSFTVGLLNPASATLLDYSVYEASNTSGTATQWRKEYSFDDTYGLESFSAGPLSSLIGRLQADENGVTKDSRSYQEHFLKGSAGKKLSPSWHGYTCSLDSPTEKTFKTCVCSAH